MQDAVVPDDAWRQDRVTRFEVIDHTTTEGEIGVNFGRILTRYGVKVTLSYQDDGRTLKVFLDKP